MSNERKDAEADARNRGLEEEEKRLHDPDNRPPHGSMESEESEAERPVTQQEKSEQDIAHLENPPQAEGPRERSNEGA